MQLPILFAARLRQIRRVVIRADDELLIAAGDEQRRDIEREGRVAALVMPCQALVHPDGGLIVLPDAFTDVRREQIIALAARHRVPTIYGYRYFTAAGGLISYGPNSADMFRRAAAYVDRILKGEKPADLPVQRPTASELAINLKTAKALGLTFPITLLGRADKVIE